MNNQIAIVYFSKDGNTRAGAQILGKRLDAKVIELKESKKGNFLQALFKKGSKLSNNAWNEIEDKKTIYLMLPIWASNVVPAMNSFLQNAQFHSKEVTIITFQQFEDLKNSDKVHKEISDIVVKKGGKIKNTYALLGGKMGHFAGEEFIMKQIDKVKIND